MPSLRAAWVWLPSHASMAAMIASRSMLAMCSRTSAPGAAAVESVPDSAPGSAAAGLRAAPDPTPDAGGEPDAGEPPVGAGLVFQFESEPGLGDDELGGEYNPVIDEVVLTLVQVRAIGDARCR
jgi:hypothetical protein